MTTWPAERAALDTALGAALDRHAPRLAPDVGDAVRYAVLGGGKRLRGVLVTLAYRACGGRGDVAPLGAAVEIVHAYSLIHDDLPCMDDDDVRRGRPTVHRAFGVRTATVAGIAMVPVAVAVLLDAGESLALPAASIAELTRRVMRASGGGGMIGGQLLDLRGEGRVVSAEELERIHRGKTGALIAVAAAVGGNAAGAAPAVVDALDHFGAGVGLAFQITDDVLDATSTTEVLGKPAGHDARLAKSTYVAALGVEGARRRARALVTEAVETVERAGLDATELRAFAGVVVERGA
jgi:geranylgeranyl diphosphate synthase type II